MLMFCARPECRTPAGCQCLPVPIPGVPYIATDLELIKQAVQTVLEKCEEANPQHMAIPASGATVMEWLAEALSSSTREKT